MCVVSMVGDHFHKKWHDHPWVYPQTPIIPTETKTIVIGPTPEITKAEFDQLKRDVAEMKELLLRAKKYDEDHGEPDCHIDEKVEILRRVADLVGVDLTEIFGPKAVVSR